MTQQPTPSAPAQAPQAPAPQPQQSNRAAVPQPVAPTTQNGAQQPQAPPVPYVPDDAVTRVTVYGKPMDVRIADLKREYGMGQAAAQRLQEASNLYSQHKGDLDTMARVRNLARTNPAAAAAEVQRAFGLQPTARAGDNSETAADDDPQTSGIRADLSSVHAKLAELEEFKAQQTTRALVQQIQAAVREAPLYKRDEEAALRAESFVAAHLTQNPRASLADAVAYVHAADVEFLTRSQQQQRDQLAAQMSSLTSLPPNAGTPGMQAPDMGARLEPKDIANGGWKKRGADYVQRVREQFGV